MRYAACGAAYLVSWKALTVLNYGLDKIVETWDCGWQTEGSSDQVENFKVFQLSSR